MEQRAREKYRSKNKNYKGAGSIKMKKEHGKKMKQLDIIALFACVIFNPQKSA